MFLWDPPTLVSAYFEPCTAAWILCLTESMMDVYSGPASSHLRVDHFKHHAIAISVHQTVNVRSVTPVSTLHQARDLVWLTLMQTGGAWVAATFYVNIAGSDV